MPEPTAESLRGDQRVREALLRLGHAGRVVSFADSTRTAADAAAAIGCSVAQIAKSLVFRTKAASRPILVIASGVNRVDERAVERLLADALDGDRIVRADANFVRVVTGFAIGGVPPVGHRVAPAVVIDQDLLAFESIWAAAGTPNAVFETTPAELVAMTGGRVGAVAQAG